MPVEQIQLDATGQLPFADASFETVVTTLTLCSLEDPAPALDEMRRVLRPGGRYHFFEHGRSDDRRIARWQDRLNPLQHLIAAGCRLDQEIDRLIAAAGFKFIALDRFLMPHTPRVLSTIYRGVATRV
jgi:SAM-dependent methyltransferase